MLRGKQFPGNLQLCGCSRLSLRYQRLIPHLRDTNCSMNSVWWWFQYPRVNNLDERGGDLAQRAFVWAFSCFQRFDMGYTRAKAMPGYPPWTFSSALYRTVELWVCHCRLSVNHALLSLSPRHLAHQWQSRLYFVAEQQVCCVLLLSLSTIFKVSF